MWTPHLIGITAAIGSAASWAVGTLLFKGIGEELSPMAMTLVKSLVGLLLLAAALCLSGWEPVNTPAFGWLAVSGVLGITLGDTLFFAALRRLAAHQLVILMLLAPVVTLLMSLLILGERPSTIDWLGIVLVLAGVSLTFKEKLDAGAATGLRGWGLTFGVLSVVSMSGSVVIAKVGLADLSALQGTFLRLGFGCAGMLTIGLGTRELPTWIAPLRQASLRWRFLLATTFVTFGGFWLSLCAIKFLEVSIANTLLATEPIFALPLAMLWLRERPTTTAFAGAGVALLGAFVLAING